ncbi:hypothetical protein DFJ63DRAFT_320809 [Scheffersomyces coipomensis]|uniref:uncharacterized protein n=1 Tax=Scheffersomyces coipomensis TaxID=1788519 RepID=UPI00315D388C
MLAPGKALLAGSVLYGAGVYWMFTNYYNKSSIKKAFVRSDAEYNNVKIMQHP